VIEIRLERHLVLPVARDSLAFGHVLANRLDDLDRVAESERAAIRLPARAIAPRATELERESLTRPAREPRAKHVGLDPERNLVRMLQVVGHARRESRGVRLVLRLERIRQELRALVEERVPRARDKANVVRRPLVIEIEVPARPP